MKCLIDARAISMTVKFEAEFKENYSDNSHPETQQLARLLIGQVIMFY